MLHDDENLTVPVRLPGLTFVITVQDVTGAEVGVEEMCAGGDEVAVEVRTGEWRTLLMESSLPDTEIDG